MCDGLQCDCYFSQSARIPGTNVFDSFEAVYYYDTSYDFNITFVFFSILVNGLHRPAGWKRDFVDPLRQRNAPTEPVRYLLSLSTLHMLLFWES